MAQVEGFELVRHLARGGMGDVFLAREVATDREVALKVALGTDADTRAMFADEAALAQHLDHPNLARVIAAGDGFLAMEYVHGIDAGDLLEHTGGPLPLSAACAIVAAAASGLDHAHRRCTRAGTPLRLVHRDVSPSNIMVGFDGRVKVIDFGIASADVALHATAPGVVRGKPGYLAPEQCMGDPVDARTDVWALGVVLYELTTGTRRFTAPSDLALMLEVVRGEYAPPSQIIPGYPPALARVIATALAVDPSRRFASAAAFRKALEVAIAIDASAIPRLMDTLFAQATVVDLPRAQPSEDDVPTRSHRALRRAA